MPDIGDLRGLVPAAEEHNDLLPSASEIDAVSRPTIDSQLGYTIANGLRIAEVASGQSLNSYANSSLSPAVSQGVEPFRELRRGPQLKRL